MMLKPENRRILKNELNHRLLFVFAFSWFIVLTGFSQPAVAVIIDTDIAPDFDDVGALALLHSLADRGEVKILATISCNTFETTVPTLSLLNTYFKRSDIPIGVTKSEKPEKACQQKWAEALVAKYPHSIARNNDAPDAVQLYRRILLSQPDRSVTV